MSHCVCLIVAFGLFLTYIQPCHPPPACQQQAEDVNEDHNDDNDEDHNEAPASQDDHKDHKYDCQGVLDTQGNPQAMSTKKTPATAPAGSTMTCCCLDAPPAIVAKKSIVPYYLDTRDMAIVAYYHNNDGVNYAKVKIHVNSMIQENACRFTLVDDGMSISWQRVISKVCFSKDRLEGVMEDNFLLSRSHVAAYSSVLQCMRHDSFNPDAGGLYCWTT